MLSINFSVPYDKGGLTYTLWLDTEVISICVAMVTKWSISVVSKCHENGQVWSDLWIVGVELPLIAFKSEYWSDNTQHQFLSCMWWRRSSLYFMVRYWGDVNMCCHGNQVNSININSIEISLKLANLAWFMNFGSQIAPCSTQ